MQLAYLCFRLAVPVRTRLADQVEILLVQLGLLVALGPPPLLAPSALASRVFVIALLVLAVVVDEAFTDLVEECQFAVVMSDTTPRRFLRAHLCRLLLIVVVVFLLAGVIDLWCALYLPRLLVARASEGLIVLV